MFMAIMIQEVLPQAVKILSWDSKFVKIVVGRRYCRLNDQPTNGTPYSIGQLYGWLKNVLSGLRK
jgi:hypothetical protein